MNKQKLAQMLNWIRYDCNVFSLGTTWVFERNVPNKHKIVMNMSPTIITVLIHFYDFNKTDMEETFDSKDYADACEAFNRYCMIDEMVIEAV